MRIKTGGRLKSTTAVEQIFEYHKKSKHSLDKYADGPEFLDWDLQPHPYRYFEGSKRIPLTLDLSDINASYESLYNDKNDSLESKPLNVDSIGVLLGLSFGLSAHKEYMGDRWSLRCNPSSGNLHPTEAYLVSSDIEGLDNGIYHYLSENHSLQQRMETNESLHNPSLVIGLSSIHWREAWKYGERAFRYCQLDIGHAISAIAYAASCLGWNINIHDDYSEKEIATLCGLDRTDDYINVESEHPDLLVSVIPCHQKDSTLKKSELLAFSQKGTWSGKANLLDKHPMYRWPVIEQASQATEITTNDKCEQALINLPELKSSKNSILAKHAIYGRRSAQAFDKQTNISRLEFYSILDKCLVRNNKLPWLAINYPFPMFTLFYVHRVSSLTPGLYLLANTLEEIGIIKSIVTKDFIWSKAANCPEHIPFYLLSNKSMENFSKTVSCHQAIASNGVFSASIITQFKIPISQHPMNYRKLHWQAGALGHLLYLEAENLGLRGTGIGCFFDDAITSSLGIENNDYQVIYNFTLGAALNDPRISTLPAYDHLDLKL